MTNKSTTISELAKALVVFHVKVDTIKKDAKNPFFKSTYASLSNILDGINEPLIESGLSIIQFPTGDYSLSTILMHESGEYIESDYTMRPVKDDPQGRGSCITYQRRYAIASVLSLNIDEDDDGNEATQPQSDNRQWLNKGEQFNNAVEFINGGGTIAQIEAKYKLSKEIKKSLQDATSNK